ncbi:unnamed protein product [Prorocentrum cordatum]|uniref:Uncharacterized protein n=1 Tax=Prorocentrum cordatum TaxID=2364126 RepID=A0ABN9RQX3_9DINO|nr:unnamed protein product [Polarella glacialis]
MLRPALWVHCLALLHVASSTPPSSLLRLLRLLIPPTPLRWWCCQWPPTRERHLPIPSLRAPPPPASPHSAPRLVLLVHPDKTSHPSAKEAFQLLAPALRG